MTVGWLARVAALLIGGAALAPLAAQDAVVADEVDGRQTLTVRMYAAAGSVAPGGLGFVRVEIDGKDDREHDLDFELGTRDWSGYDIGVHRRLRLPPGERLRFFAPLPSGEHEVAYRLLVDGREHEASVALARGSGVTALLLSERGDELGAATTLLGAVPRLGKASPTVTLCLPDDLPADWRLLTAFHLLIVDGRAPLPGEAQEAVRRFVFAGGIAVLVAPQNLPPGPLRTLLPLGAEVAGHGLGTVAALPTLASGGEPLRRVAAALPVLSPSPWPGALASPEPQQVPGLGEPPVGGFLAILILFAVVAGPLNLLWTRRRKRPLLLLATIPALGLGTSVMILGYGYLHDGLGVRGAETSWTWLDQARHEVAVVSLRTLFAGAAPADLQLGPDTFVISPRASQRARRIVDNWRLELDSGRLGSGVLPPRTPTPLLVRQQGTARERLRARRIGDQLELLPDGGIVPVGDVLLRDLDGIYWHGAAGRLARVSGNQASTSLAAWRSEAETLPLVGAEEVPWAGPRGEREPVSAAPVARRLLPQNELPNGSYLLMTQVAPWLDQHGLEVAFDDRRHFVFGTMSAEDFVR